MAADANHSPWWTVKLNQKETETECCLCSCYKTGLCQIPNTCMFVDMRAHIKANSVGHAFPIFSRFLVLAAMKLLPVGLLYTFKPSQVLLLLDC